MMNTAANYSGMMHANMHGQNSNFWPRHAATSSAGGAMGMGAAPSGGACGTQQDSRMAEKIVSELQVRTETWMINHSLDQRSLNFVEKMLNQVGFYQAVLLLVFLKTETKG